MEGLSKEEEIKRTFDLMDRDKDGNIDVKELERYILCQGIEIPQEELQEMIEKIDTNGDGKIQFNEFKLAMEKMSSADDDESLMKQIFEALDRSSDKVISKEELKYAFYCLGEFLTDEEVRTLIEYASGGNDSVSFDNFCSKFKNFIKS